MAFFETLGGKIINAGQSIAQSTKNFADVTKLNSAISDYEKQIVDLYTIVGKSYYERHKNDANAEEQQRIMAINTLFKQIDGLKQQIKDIEGIVKCPNCGADVPRDSLFCSSCGSKVVKETAARHCSNCGMPLAADSMFCAHCGTKVEQAEAIVENDKMTETAQKLCPVCHAVLSEEDVFCSECGTPVNKTQQTVEVADAVSEPATPDPAVSEPAVSEPENKEV